MMMIVCLLHLFIVASHRGGEPVHSYSARFADGKLLYNGTVYEHGQQILIETRNSPAVQYVSVVAFFWIVIVYERFNSELELLIFLSIYCDGIAVGCYL